MGEEMKPTEGGVEKQDKSNLSMGVEKISLRNIVQIVYLCQALSFFFGITAIVGVIINYINLPEVKGTWLESHFTWQIRTFWIGLGISIVGLILMMVFIGFLVLMANLVWIVYRVVKGWLLLSENKPIENCTALI